jgi:hypothetical protein
VGSAGWLRDGVLREVPTKVVSDFDQSRELNHDLRQLNRCERRHIFRFAMTRIRLIASAFLLALLVTGAVLPLAAAGAAGAGCHCKVRMACCEEGTCPMGGHEAPAEGPEWRTCRREASATAPPPLDAFDRALMTSVDATRLPPVGEAAAIDPAHPRSATFVPTTPPPRSLSF